MRAYLLQHRTSSDVPIRLRELLYTNHQRIEGIRTIGAGLQLILFSLSQLLSTLILLAVIHSCQTDGDEQVFIVLAIDHYLVLSSSHKHTVEEQHLLEMSHRVAQIHIVHIPAMVCEVVGDEGMEVIIHQGVVVAHEGGVVVEVHLLAAVILVILHELIEQGRQLLLILHEDTLQTAGFTPQVVLSYGYPVDQGVGIEGDAQRAVGIHVIIHA